MFRRLCAVAFLLLASCRSGDRPRLVVLVSIDTLRADHLGFYGYHRETSPNLDRLALESAVFDDAMSTSPWTLPAHASLLTGLYPSRHGLTSHDRYLASSLSTLPQLFSKAGYRTAAVVNSHNLAPEFGLDRGFEQYRYVEERVSRKEPSFEITDQAMEWVRQAGGEPLFLFLHYYDVHSDYVSLRDYEAAFLKPYDGAADGTTAQLAAYREGKIALSASDAPNLIDRYDAGIFQMDLEIGRFLDFLKKEGLWEDALFVLTSDHGEEFFEHGGVLHGQTQYQEVIRVPLLIKGPDVPAGRRVAYPVSLVDVVPTLAARAGLGAPPGIDGIDLSPLLADLEEKTLDDRYLFSEADHNNVEHDITRSVRHRTFKLHFNRLSREYRLFDLARDPAELEDIAPREKDALAALTARLDRFLASEKLEAPVRTLSEEEIEKLRSLGYLR